MAEEVKINMFKMSDTQKFIWSLCLIIMAFAAGFSLGAKYQDNLMGEWFDNNWIDWCAWRHSELNAEIMQSADWNVSLFNTDETNKTTDS